MTTAVIFIRDLHCDAIIGVYNSERLKSQPLILNLDLHTNINKAMKSDDIHDTVNYAEIVNDIKELVLNSRFQLIEALANEISEVVLQNHFVNKVKIEINKPHAIPGVNVGIVFEKSKQS